MKWYFDTDVLVHYVVIQDETKHHKATELIDEAIKNDKFAISILVLQEFCFVLAKLQVEKEKILRNLTFFRQFTPLICTPQHFQRSCEIADKLSFKQINDCIHTSIAEEHCEALITYNKDDFKKIQRHTGLKINIL